MKRVFTCIWLAIVLATLLQAHFVFVTPEAGGATVRVFISENLKPDLDVKMIGSTKLTLRDAGGAETPLSLSKAETNFFSAALAGSGTRVVYGDTNFGVMERGGKTHLLIYYPKAIVGDAFDAKTQVGEKAPVELIPVGSAGSLKLRLIAHGKPLADSEITVILPDGAEKKVKTGANGETEAFSAPGRYGAWARFWEPIPGERDGKKYGEVRNYATLVFDTAASTRASAAPSANSFSKLPQATSSFGSTVSDGWLYVYGGHVSPTHSYFKEAVSGRFDRVKLSGEPVWESLPEGPAVQGMNLAAYQGKIYRVGGMTPRNEKGQAADNYSIADVARFDPTTKKWEVLPPLPEPRSSHDVVVAGDKLIVIGGWTLAGKSETWRDTVEILDLSAKKPEWKSVPQPFKRRALMAVALDGKVYAIGGMDDKQKVTRDVSIYDPKTNQWSEGPKLPEGAILGFAPAAGLHQGRLYVSLSDGSLMRLDGDKWEKTAAATPRVAHRLAARGESILLIGGAAKGKNFDLIEAVPVATGENR